MSESNLLQSLKEYSIVVADTGDFQSIKEYEPQDATTNPSLIYQAVQLEQYKPLVNGVIDSVLKEGSVKEVSQEVVDKVVDNLFIKFGTEILKIVKGRVSTELDARLSYDTEKSIEKARHLIELYKKEGISADRILVKIASTWEGIQAAKQLEKEGIHCNLTLLFAKVQAVACAQSKITLISPFVGRILDFYKSKNPEADYNDEKDPGVVSVKAIYNYYKKNDVSTVVMGASFRNIGELIQLAGVDLLTISPKLLKELKNKNGKLERKLSVESAKKMDNEDVAKWDELTKEKFEEEMKKDEMASFKLPEGIKKFSEDLEKLEKEVREIIENKLKQ